MVAKYAVLSNTISVASDNILRLYIQELLLIPCNSLIVRYKVYSPDPRTCLCTRLKHGEGYVYLSIDSEPCPTCRTNPIKNKLVITNCQPLLLQKITLT